MGEQSLIPFGLRLSDQQFVDVSDVDRGRKCDCICPSCKTPLIARQGEVNEWHFAHVSKGVSDDTKNECEYSFWVSVALMSKQVMANASSIMLPSLTMYTIEGAEVKVTEQQEVSIDDVEIEQKIHQFSADAILSVGDYIIAILFSAPHRPLDCITEELIANDKIGVLEVSLFEAYHWLFKSNNQGKYTQSLKQNILSNSDCKRWLFHPRKSAVEKQFDIELFESNQAPIEKTFMHSHNVEHKQYKCVWCSRTWYGTHVCSHCRTHLYSTEAT